MISRIKMNFLINFWRVTPFRLRHDIYPFPFCCLASLDVRPGKIVYESVENTCLVKIESQQWYFFFLIFVCEFSGIFFENENILLVNSVEIPLIIFF